MIVLRYYEDLTEADTAAALGCSVGSEARQGPNPATPQPSFTSTTRGSCRLARPARTPRPGPQRRTLPGPGGRRCASRQPVSPTSPASWSTLRCRCGRHRGLGMSSCPDGHRSRAPPPPRRPVSRPTRPPATRRARHRPVCRGTADLPLSVTATSTRTFVVLGGVGGPCPSGCLRLTQSNDGGPAFTALPLPTELGRCRSRSRMSRRSGSAAARALLRRDLWSATTSLLLDAAPSPPCRPAGGGRRLGLGPGRLGQGRRPPAFWSSPVGADDWARVPDVFVTGPADLSVQGRRVVVLGAQDSRLWVGGTAGYAEQARPGDQRPMSSVGSIWAPRHRLRAPPSRSGSASRPCRRGLAQRPRGRPRPPAPRRAGQQRPGPSSGSQSTAPVRPRRLAARRHQRGAHRLSTPQVGYADPGHPLSQRRSPTPRASWPSAESSAFGGGYLEALADRPPDVDRRLPAASAWAGVRPPSSLSTCSSTTESACGPKTARIRSQKSVTRTDPVSPAVSRPAQPAGVQVVHEPADCHVAEERPRPHPLHVVAQGGLLVAGREEGDAAGVRAARVADRRVDVLLGAAGHPAASVRDDHDPPTPSR